MFSEPNDYFIAFMKLIKNEISIQATRLKVTTFGTLLIIYNTFLAYDSLIVPIF